jgi:hypothetical protein
VPEHRRARSTFAPFLAFIGLACSDSTGPNDTVRDLQIVSGNAQTTRRGDDVAEPLRVRAVDAEGRPVQGTLIRWSVTQGQVTLDPSQSTTTSSGEAATRIKNVGTIGPVEVRASVHGASDSFPAATLSATSLDPCLLEAMPPYELGTVLMGALRPLDCLFSDRTLWDFYALRLSAQQAVAIRLRSDSITPPEVGLWDRNGRHRGGTFTTVTEAVMKAILAPGAYGIGAGSLSIDVTGPYQLFASVTSTSADDCQIVFVVRGIATTQELAASDCVDPSGPSYDRFSFVLYADERVIVTQSSTQFEPRLRLVNRLTETVMAEADGNAGGTATIDFTATSTALYRIYASSVLSQQSGAYTLAVSHPPGAALNATAPSTRRREASPERREGTRPAPLSRGN